MQMLPGTDLIFSGYSSVPNYDNMFAGSNFDCDDYDDYPDPAARPEGRRRPAPVAEAEAIAIRNKAARGAAGRVR